MRKYKNRLVEESGPSIFQAPPLATCLHKKNIIHYKTIITFGKEAAAGLVSFQGLFSQLAKQPFFPYH
jgi:hypothetical protein